MYHISNTPPSEEAWRRPIGLILWTGDASTIICRNNAPLLRMAFRLISSGRSVNVLGSDLGPRLVDPEKARRLLHLPPSHTDQHRSLARNQTRGRVQDGDRVRFVGGQRRRGFAARCGSRRRGTTRNSRSSTTSGPSCRSRLRTMW